LAVSLAASGYNQGVGWGHNIATGEDVHLSQAFSLDPKIVWTPDDKTKVTAWVFYETLRDDLGVAQNFLPGSKGINGTYGPTNFYDVDQSIQSFYINKQVTASVQPQRDFGWAIFKAITAYSVVTSTGQKDSADDGTPVGYSYQEPADQSESTFTQELRLTSVGDHRINWVGGVFYFNDLSLYDPVGVVGAHNTSVCSPPVAPTACTYYDIADRMRTNSIAGYAQATAHLLAGLDLTAGVRYTEDWRHILGGNYGSNGFVFGYGNQQMSWGDPTYKVALDYAITPDVMAYVSYSTGFNSGSFNTGSPNQPAVNPATIDATEAGIKSQWFDNRLRLNLAGFYYDYDNMVLKQLQPNASNILYNAAKAELYGADVQFDAEVTRQLSFQGALEFLHTEFLSFANAPATVLKASGGDSTIYVNYAGQPIFNAPKFTATIAGQYVIPLPTSRVVLGAQYQYNSGFNWAATANANGQITDRDAQPAYSLLNLSADWIFKDGKWDVRLWGKNVTGTKYYAQVATSSYGDLYSPAPPATFGVTFGVKY
jgi:iron complex outermembrane receptor protein